VALHHPEEGLATLGLDHPGSGSESKNEDVGLIGFVEQPLGALRHDLGAVPGDLGPILQNSISAERFLDKFSS
jgi:hypothetical protein